MPALASVVFAFCLTSYIALTAVGFYCAVASGRIVEKALGKSLAESPTVSTLLYFIAAFAVIWIGGLSAMMGQGGIHHAIANGAERHINQRTAPDDKRRIRTAVREYRKRHKLT